MKTARYSLLMMRPDPERIDTLCVGAAVLDADGLWHVGLLPGPEKLAAVGAARAQERLPILGRNLRELLAECDTFESARAMLDGSTLALHDFEGRFAYENAAEFAAHVEAIMRESVLVPEPAGDTGLAAARQVRPHTRARLRRQFAQMGILARSAGEIVEHKVVANFPVSARHGLTAEFALRNAAMHITETVDFDVVDDRVRGKTFEAQAKCLVLRTAIEAFGADTQCYVVVSGGGAAHASRSVDLLSTAGRLFALESAEDMSAYFDRIASAAGTTRQITARPPA